MSMIEATGNQKYFAALKLIEKLYKEGLIPQYIFRNILTEYDDIVDTSCFSTCLVESNERERE